MILYHDDYITWHEREDGIDYSITVRPAHRKDERGASGWAWEILALRKATVVHRCASGADLIFGWGDRLDMLDTLVSFLGAWAEAVDYASAGHESDNLHLFPPSGKFILPYVDNLTCEVMFEVDERDERKIANAERSMG